MRYGQGKRKSCSRYGMCDLKQETGPGRGIRAPLSEMLTGCFVRLGGPTGWPSSPGDPAGRKWQEHWSTGKHGRSWTRARARARGIHPLLGKGAVRAPPALLPCHLPARVPRYSGTRSTLGRHTCPPSTLPLPPRLPRPPYLARCNSGQATGDFRRAGCSCSCQSSVGGEPPRRPGHSALSLAKTWPTAAFCRVEIPLPAYRLSNCLATYTCSQVIQSLPPPGYGSTRPPALPFLSAPWLGWAGLGPGLAWPPASRQEPSTAKLSLLERLEKSQPHRTALNNCRAYCTVPCCIVILRSQSLMRACT